MSGLDVVSRSGRDLPVALVITLLCSVLLSAGCCGEECQVRRASIALVEQATTADTAVTPAVVEETPPVCRGTLGPSDDVRTRFYVDASQSMAGFVGEAGSSTEFDEALDRIAVDLGVTDVVLFGERPAGDGGLFEHRPIERQLHVSTTYNRLHNPDYCLLEAIEADNATLHVYVTDGVQSASDYGIPSPSVRRLQAWLSGGNALAIVALRSRFSGRAWSEQRRQWIGSVSVEARPYYVFLFARSEDDLDRGLDRLSTVRGRGTVFRFRTSPWQCDMSPRGQRKFENRKPLWVFLPTRVQDEHQVHPGSIGAYECRIDSEYPLESILLRVEARYRGWLPSESTFGEPGDLPLGAEFRSDSIELRSGGSTVHLSGVFPDDPDTRFGFYEVRAVRQPGALRDAIGGMSTDSDASAESFDRTYRISWLFEHLVRSAFEDDQGTESFFVTVQYR